MSIFYFPSLGSWDFVACVLYVESERAKRGEEKTLLWSSPGMLGLEAWPRPRGLSRPKFCGLGLGLEGPGLGLGLEGPGLGLEGPGLGLEAGVEVTIIIIMILTY